jgi:hypothetical protein
MPVLPTILLGIAALLAVPFVLDAVGKGVMGLAGISETRLRHPGASFANLGIFAHMMTGAAITALAFVQALPVVRRRWPRLHRRSGRLLVVAALLTSAGGLVYIIVMGTIGGAWMSFGFALYGLVLGGAAIATWRFAVRGDLPRHRRWGLRLIWLALGSWLYRVSYGLWVMSVGEVGIRADFTGPFDRFMVLAFFVVPLLAVELRLRWRGHVEPLPAHG